MTKQQNIDDPNSCFNKARDDEIVFVLLERDIATPAAIRAWAMNRVAAGKNNIDDPQIVEARHVANLIEAKHQHRPN